MTAETLSNPEQSREKEPSSKEVWVVDDNIEATTPIMKIWQMKTRERGYSFQLFETAQAALEEIERRRETKEKLPAMIFIDGTLEKDEGELQIGTNVIREIRNIKDIEQPKIIAHSTEGETNEKLKEAGADFAFRKMDIMETSEFLKDPEGYKEKESPP